MTQSLLDVRRATPIGEAGTTAPVLFAMCLGVFIAQLDSSVVYLGARAIGTDLHASITATQWVLDIYNLVYATMLMTGGALGDLLGRRRMFIWGIVLIAAGSLICAAAPNSAVLIAGRGLTGLGSALEIPASLAILTVTYPDPHARGRAIGFWASCNGLAMAVGPSVGGFLVDSLGWRSIFYVVIPVCLLAIWMALRRVEESRDPGHRELDPAGQVLAIATLGALSFVAIEGPHRGWITLPILLPTALAIASAIVFARVERGRPAALLPFDLFSNRAFSAALCIAGLMTFGMYAMLFLVPIYLQSVAELSPTMAGLALIPISLVFVAVSQLSGPLTKQVGARVMTAAGMGFMGGGLALLVFVLPTVNLLAIEVALSAIGIGLGLNTGPVNAVAVASVPPGRSGTASGLINTTRMVGATLGIATLGTIYAIYAGGQGPVQLLTGFRLALAGGAVAELSGVAVALLFIGPRSAEQKH
jgi:DHA2 family methylenomycin A resistance protein-like MFS transporter